MIKKMRKLLFPVLLLLSILSLGQTNYYTFNTDVLISEGMVRAVCKEAEKTIPGNYMLVPTIYHKVEKGDSVINYLTFSAQPCGLNSNRDFKFTFVQDSLFLLLDKKLPEFKLKDLEGNEFSSDQFLGKPALINFWGIYCGPCVEEIPKLNELKAEYGNKMNFIAITEKEVSTEALKKFLDKTPFNYLILENSHEYKKALKIGGIPKNIFIDQDGYIRSIQGNYPFKTDGKTGEKIYQEDNSFKKIIEELTLKQ
jgi:thiol-disulfide isomerase/thioredoxin